MPRAAVSIANIFLVIMKKQQESLVTYCFNCATHPPPGARQFLQSNSHKLTTVVQLELPMPLPPQQMPLAQCLEMYVHRQLPTVEICLAEYWRKEKPSTEC